jgi:predicted  nucleic acid-binding Zn-ribbon protein
MSKYKTYEDIKQEAEKSHVTAETLDILVSKTKELSAARQNDIDKLNALLEKIEEKLQPSSETDK